VRVSERPGAGEPTRQLAVVEPHGLRAVPAGNGADSVQYDANGAPALGSGYELLRTYVPDVPGSSRYYMYSVDVTDPNLERRWRELQHAERAERRLARAENRNDQAWERRKERLLDAHGHALEEGIAHLQGGRYRDAVISLTRAAELNQGDPICRIHLVQARVALGHDADAARVLRRALDLQPKLVPAMLGLGQYYPHEEEFPIHVDALAQRVSANAHASAELYFLLGFMEFQCGWLDDAYGAFCRAAQARPKDTVIQTYLDLTKPPARDTDRSASPPTPQRGGRRSARP
jgi:tetratricopeptide (TPR) repeat protein